MKITKNSTIEVKSGDFLLIPPLLPVNGYDIPLFSPA